MKPHSLFLMIFILSGTVAVAQSADTLKYIDLSPADFLSDLKSSKNAVVIDVRKSKDYRKSRIEGAINIEFSLLEDYFTSPDLIDNRKSIFIYCYVGYQSKRAAVIFYDHGYRNIFSLDGGFMKWKSKKMPIDNKKAQGTKEH